VKFRVSDYGQGVKFPDKMFQAFFTRPIGQGTGIGLSIAYGILKGTEEICLLNSSSHII
jgi:signal transduction histidine kinase